MGHKLYYNFIKPHESLYGQTPAKYAGIDLEIGSCKWQNLLMLSIKNEKEK